MGNPTQYYVMAYMRKESKKDLICVYLIHLHVPLKLRNIVNQLYSNKNFSNNKKKHALTWCKDLGKERPLN